MPLITANRAGHAVVVERARTVATVTQASDAVTVRERESLAIVRDRPRVLVVPSPGPQGPRGEPGLDAGAAPSLSYPSAHSATLRRGTPVAVVGGGLVPATSDVGFHDVLGLVLDETIEPGHVGRVQTAGILELTVPEWNAVTGQVGGLAPERTYFLTADGGMGPDAPTVGMVAPVGYASSATAFLIETGPVILL